MSWATHCESKSLPISASLSVIKQEEEKDRLRDCKLNESCLDVDIRVKKFSILGKPLNDGVGQHIYHNLVRPTVLMHSTVIVKS